MVRNHIVLIEISCGPIYADIVKRIKPTFDFPTVRHAIRIRIPVNRIGSKRKFFGIVEAVLIDIGSAHALDRGIKSCQ